MTYTITENNAETGESVTRDMTEEEIEKVEALIAADAAEAAKIQADAIAKAALLERLGITEDEAKLLLS
jgi:hypothetical protein